MDPSRRAAIRAQVLASLAEPAALPEPASRAGPAAPPAITTPAVPAVAAAGAVHAGRAVPAGGAVHTGVAGAASGRGAHAAGRPWSGAGRRVRREEPGRARLPLVARALLAGGLSAVVTMAGVAATAANALPGEPLYTVKRQVENFQVALRRDPVERAKTRLTVAGTRMDELHTVTGTGTAPGEHAGAAPAAPTSPSQPSAWTPAPTSASPNGTPTPQRSGAPAAGPMGRAPSLPASDPFPAATVAPPRPAGGRDGTTRTPGAADRQRAAAGEHPDADTVNSLLRSWCAQAAAGSRVLLVQASAGDADAWRTMNTFTTTQASQLATVLSALPAGTTESARAATDLIGQFRVSLDAHTPPPASSAPRPVRPSASVTAPARAPARSLPAAPMPFPPPRPGPATPATSVDVDVPDPPARPRTPPSTDARDLATASPTRAAPTPEASSEEHGLPAPHTAADSEPAAEQPPPSAGDAAEVTSEPTVAPSSDVPSFELDPAPTPTGVDQVPVDPVVPLPAAPGLFAPDPAAAPEPAAAADPTVPGPSATEPAAVAAEQGPGRR